MSTSSCNKASPWSSDAWSGQTALVTGSGGIGGAVARSLAMHGCRVCLVDLKQDALDAAALSLKTAVPSAEVITVAADVGDIQAAAAAVDTVVKRWGRLDVLVQTAGITGVTNVKTGEVDPNNFDQVMRVNLRGIFAFCRAALPIMARQGYGRVVNVASVAGKEGNAGMVAYSTSKAAVIGLTKTIGKEYAESGVTVNAVAPAVVRTAMVAAMPPAQVKYMTDKIPMKRTCELEEVTNVILFAASRACSFTTGFTWDVTGGRSTY